MCGFYTKTQEPYAFLLQRREWKAKRHIILERDNYTCQECGCAMPNDSELHVHHKHYIYGLDPWEYRDSELITLCEDCHSKIHRNTVIPHFRWNKATNMLEKVELTPCTRCGGMGYFREYKHIQNGICFRCHGARYDEYITLYENYAEEHDIDLSDINDGYIPVSQAIINSCKEVLVKKSNYKDILYLQLTMNDNGQRIACLDFSVNAKQGDKLEPKSLLLKYGVNRLTKKEYVIMKGKII